jgi:hypothetical protein
MTVVALRAVESALPEAGHIYRRIHYLEDLLVRIAGKLPRQ